MTDNNCEPMSAEDLKDLERLNQVAIQRRIDEVVNERRACYQRDSDPLFFGWQRGDNTEQEWLDAVQAVKDAYPYPEAV